MGIPGVYAFILCILCGSAYGRNSTKNDDVSRRFELLEQKEEPTESLPVGISTVEIVHHGMDNEYGQNNLDSVIDQNVVVSKLQQVAEIQSYMINDQADLIQKQAKEIDELKRVAELRSNEIDNANPGPLAANGGPSVLFFARISKEEIAHIPMNKKIIFDQTILNKGYGYHSSTGTFVAPVAGIYFFSLSVSTLRDGKDIHAGIMKNGMPVAGAYAHGYGQGSTTVVIPLNAFEPVWVSNMHHADAYLWGHTLTSFMGFRLGDY